jgi:hypothetical protein
MQSLQAVSQTTRAVFALSLTNIQDNKKGLELVMAAVINGRVAVENRAVVKNRPPVHAINADL